jgi:CBS domain containing-hemolysin-like protein
MQLDDDIFEDIQGDADSLAGLLLEIKGEFPTLHEKIDYHNITFEILDMEERRISKVKVVVHEKPVEK